MYKNILFFFFLFAGSVVSDRCARCNFEVLVNNHRFLSRDIDMNVAFLYDFIRQVQPYLNQIPQQPPQQPLQQPKQPKQPEIDPVFMDIYNAIVSSTYQQFLEGFLRVDGWIYNSIIDIVLSEDEKLLLQRQRFIFYTYFSDVQEIEENQHNLQFLLRKKEDIAKDKILSDALKQKLYDLIDSYNL